MFFEFPQPGSNRHILGSNQYNCQNTAERHSAEQPPMSTKQGTPEQPEKSTNYGDDE